MHKQVQAMGKLAAAFGLAITVNTAASAAPTNLVAAGNTNPPIGHFEFCKTYPNECTALGRDSGPMELTRKRWATMLEINTRVNQSIRPDTDLNIYGVEELWSYPRSVGDCEDYVLLKRHMLMEKGFSPKDLLITVVLQPNGDGHAVLTVRTDYGDYILDNILNPSGEIPEGYQLLLVTTRSGQTLAGTLASENEQQLVLRVVGLPPVTVAKSEIQSRETIPTSMMPDGLLASLQDEDVIDLIGYLQTTQQVAKPK